MDPLFIPLFPFSHLFALAFDERSNMFVAANEKNSTKSVANVNGAISRRDEYVLFSIIMPFKIKPNQFASISCSFPPVVYFSGFHVVCFKFWLLYASYSQVIITISSA